MAKGAYIGVPTLTPGPDSIANLVEGNIVKIKENGILVDFYVAKHDYESALNGAGRTLLVRKDCYDNRAWNGSNSNYWEYSSIYSWLNSSYKALFDTNIQNLIGSTRYYIKAHGNATEATVLSSSVFLLSTTEYGTTGGVVAQGSALPIIDILKVAYLNGTATFHWTRTPVQEHDYWVFDVTSSGSSGYTSCTTAFGSRPCFTIPSTTGVYNGVITGEQSIIQTGVARKIKKGYIGINGVARKIKKAYIGIGGVARPCWSGGEVAYYGTATALSRGKGRSGTATVGDYAVFAGGYDSGGASSHVNAYNKSLERINPTQLPAARQNLGSATVGNYAIFAAGTGTSDADHYYNAYIYDTSLTLTTKALSKVCGKCAAASVGDYAIFAGGFSYGGTYAEAYNSSLTRKNLTALSNRMCSSVGVTVGNHALIAGGKRDSLYLSQVEVYDSSLTRTTATSLSKTRTGHTATTINGYALIAGGYNGNNESNYHKTVDSYNESLTMTTITSLSTARADLASTTLGDYALFAGGSNPNSYNGVNTVDMFDMSLTRTITQPLSVARMAVTAATVGDYALFAGGLGSERHTTVDVYMV